MVSPLTVSETISASEPRRGSRRESIVQSLISDIVQGRLAAGQHLVTQELAERFGVSHTPIREALITLGGIGLLMLQPNRGAVVRQISAREVRDLCRVRVALECEAVRSACGHIPTTSLKGLRAQFQELQNVSRRHLEQGRPHDEEQTIILARTLDSQLHDLILQSSGNLFLAQEMNRLKVLYRGLRDASWEHHRVQREVGRLEEEANEHLAIVEALLAGNRKDASRAMARHLMSGMAYWTRALPPSAENWNRPPPSELMSG